MQKKYNVTEEEPMMLGEAAVDYACLESSVDEKVAFLRKNLHPSTVAYLEQCGYMMNQPFPYNEEELTDDWLNETDEQNPIVPDEVIKHDREVWLSVR